MVECLGEMCAKSCTVQLSDRGIVAAHLLEILLHRMESERDDFIGDDETTSV